MKHNNLNVSNTLTVLRILMLPLLIFCFFKNNKTFDLLAFSIFVFGSITDYLDGLYARKKQQTTKLGQTLDPLADKLFVTTTIELILGFNLTEKYNIIAMIIIMCREIIVSNMRSKVQEKSDNFTTSMMSKVKTCTQMLALSGILLNNICHNSYISIISTLLLWLSSILAISSCYQYFYRYKTILIENK